MRRGAVSPLLVIAFTWGVDAAEPVLQPAPARPRDAAEAVQEGSMANWLEYYRRERGAQWETPKEAPADRPAPAPSVPAATPER